MLKPPKLRAGDTIGVISPASKPPDEQKFWRGIEYLKNRGFSVVVGKNALKKRGYLAGRDKERAEDLNEMFRRPDIQAIICARGGYGGPRLLELIDYDAIKQNPKIFVGYSDITVLQNAIMAQTGLITYSGPMVAVEMGAGIHPYTEEHFWPLLIESLSRFSLENPIDQPWNVIQEGVAEGPIVGGCLSVITPLIGSRYFPDYSGGILVVEDIDEEAYRIDRALFHIRAAGILNQLNAIVFGDFIDCEAKDRTKPSLTVEEVLHDAIQGLSIPVIKDFAYGHGRTKLTLPFGARARLDTSTNRFEVIESVAT